MKIHIALVHRRHGTNTYAAASAEDLNSQLVEYVSESIVTDRLEHLAGLPDEEVVQAYFHDDHVMNFTDEGLDLIVTDVENPLLAPMQWLLDDMFDTGVETHDSDGSIYDSVESAAAALVENGGSLSWYDLDQATAYRAKEAA